MGVDYAGTVEAVGAKVTRFKPGDPVFGGRNGAFAEYVAVREDRNIVAKPDNVSFAEAASVPIAALTALQALRDKGHLEAGQKVLVNGASGAVGTFAVQIAKALGAEVTGVCSTRNLELVRGIGADHAIDYTREDVTQRPERYDLIVDTVMTHGLFEYKKILKPEGRFVIVGGVEKGDWLGPMSAPLKAFVLRPFIGPNFGFMLAELNPKDLAFVAELMQSGKVKPVLDRTYTLAQTGEALAYVEAGHARGKVVIDMDPGAAARQ